jgi:hypothetical protein
MANRSERWIKGCGLGCGGALLLSILVMFILSRTMMGGMRDAIDVRQQLDARFGDQASYTPAADGAVAADRLERFLAVRQAVMTTCGGFQATAAQFQRMDAIDDEAPTRQIAGEMKNLMGEVFRMVPRMGEFFEARNGALMAQEMGLGEYTYIYVCAYRDRLRNMASADAAFGDPEINARVHDILRGMLQRQLQSMPVDHPGRDALRQEVDLLADHPLRLVWYDGLPDAVTTSLAPYRGQLDDVFCEATMGLEFNVNHIRGMSVVGE